MLKQTCTYLNCNVEINVWVLHVSVHISDRENIMQLKTNSPEFQYTHS